MALKWYCKGKTKDYGPFSFQDLVKLTRAGKLTEDHLVKRESSTRWEKARDVIGLFQVVTGPEGEEHVVPAKERQEAADHETADSPTKTDSTSRRLRYASATDHETNYRSERKRLVTLRRAVLVVAAAVLLVATTVLGLRAQRGEPGRPFGTPDITSLLLIEARSVVSAAGFP